LKGPIRVLLIEDHAGLRHLLRSNLEHEPGLLVIGEASDGLAAVRLAQELKPDLILLDIGLPGLNGIEAARRIRDVAPQSTILFLSENRSFSIVREALRSGGNGYVVKSNSSEELLPAIFSVLQGNQFVSSVFSDRDLRVPRGSRREEISRCHEVGFYPDDRRFLEDVTVFLGSALLAGNSAIVLATEGHREIILPSLKSYGVDIGEAIQQGRYIAIDAVDALSKFMVNGKPDPAQFMIAFGNLLLMAKEAANGEQPRVAVFGECVQILCADGNAEAAIQMEKLGNRLASKYPVDILCGYSVNQSHDGMDGHLHERICAEHSVVRFAGNRALM
jgi:CheY-like chemotaxis protein